MNTITQPEGLLKIADAKVASLYYAAHQQAVVIVTKVEYISMDQFRELFSSVTSLIHIKRVQKLIFDKRSMKVFHQPSMEWYYTDWKTKMLANYGLRNHYKLLPNDMLFRKSVDIGRAKIQNAAPEGSLLKELNIRYFETLEEALDA